MRENSPLLYKSKQFSLRIIKLYKYLAQDNKEYVMSKQILRSGTSIGANIAESIYAQSDLDFISKLSIARKEGSETQYWLELLVMSEYISEKAFISLKEDCDELMKLLTVSIRKKQRKLIKQ